MAGSVSAQQLAFLGDLDGIANDTYSYCLAPVVVADPVSGPGERDATGRVDFTEDFFPGGGWFWSGGSCPAGHPVVVLDQVTSGMSGNDHTVM